MSGRIIILAACVAIIVVIAWQAMRQETQLTVDLPPRELYASQEAARVGAETYSQLTGGADLPVLGTGSMAPWIPAAKAGLDPGKTVVAFAVLNQNLGFKDIRRGMVCLYYFKTDMKFYMHVAAQQDRGGWIMSGINNPTSDKGIRVTAENFRGIVAKVFTWKQ